MNTTYETFKKDNRLKLFGHEDAGKEDNSRLTSYYYKTLQYEDVMSDIKLQIVTGEKGKICSFKNGIYRNFQYRYSSNMDQIR